MMLPFLLAFLAQPLIAGPVRWLLLAVGAAGMFSLWRYVPFVKR